MTSIGHPKRTLFISNYLGKSGFINISGSGDRVSSIFRLVNFHNGEPITICNDVENDDCEEPVYWGNNSKAVEKKRAPKDGPKCGFKNELCRKSKFNYHAILYHFKLDISVYDNCQKFEGLCLFVKSFRKNNFS